MPCSVRGFVNLHGRLRRGSFLSCALRTGRSGAETIGHGGTRTSCPWKDRPSPIVDTITKLRWIRPGTSTHTKAFPQVPKAPESWISYFTIDGGDKELKKLQRVPMKTKTDR